MSPSKGELDATTRTQWRELGFFYDVDEEARRWVLVGSREGLLRFAALLRAYCLKPKFAKDGEHDHFGPYWYLKFLTWPSAGIDENAIHGSLADLERLAHLVEQRIASAQPGDSIALATAYAPDCEYELVLEIRGDDFDPSSIDPCLG